MSKVQRSNKEVKKPKKDLASKPVAGASIPRPVTTFTADKHKKKD